MEGDASFVLWAGREKVVRHLQPCVVSLAHLPSPTPPLLQMPAAAGWNSFTAQQPSASLALIL